MSKFYGVNSNVRLRNDGNAVVQPREMKQVWEFILKAMTGNFGEADIAHVMLKHDFWGRISLAKTIQQEGITQ